MLRDNCYMRNDCMIVRGGCVTAYVTHTGSLIPKLVYIEITSDGRKSPLRSDGWEL
jgi:hypothetical protein